MAARQHILACRHARLGACNIAAQHAQAQDGGQGMHTTLNLKRDTPAPEHHCHKCLRSPAAARRRRHHRRRHQGSLHGAEQQFKWIRLVSMQPRCTD
jgi:hypothetical protein